MKKLISILLCLITVPAFGASYRAAMVADMDSGHVLYQENTNTASYPASLTKIMTLYLTFDALEHGRLHLDDYLIVSQKAAKAAPVKLGLVAGGKIRVEDAIKALTVLSANDVARVLAENLKGGEEGNFASLMTRVAHEIGLTNTNFENSSGLPDDDHLSTVRDITLLSMAVYKHFPQYWKYFGIKNWTYGGKTYTNTNRLLGTYPGCDGMKTGFTNKSRYSLVATAKHKDRHLIAVVLGAENKDVRAQVARDLLNKGFKIVGLDVDSADYVASEQPKIIKKYSYAPKQNYDEIPPTLPAAYVAATAMPVQSTHVAGSAGVQFGAFSSSVHAQNQVARVKNMLGVNPVIEPSENGLFRVRVKGLSDSEAQKLKIAATNFGIDNFIFH